MENGKEGEGGGGGPTPNGKSHELFPFFWKHFPFSFMFQPYILAKLKLQYFDYTFAAITAISFHQPLSDITMYHLPTMYDLWHAQSRHPHQPGPHHLNLKHKGNQPYLQRLWIIFCNNFSGEFRKCAIM